MSLYTEEVFMQDIIPSLFQKGRLMGLDVGKKRVGIAISDNSWTIATPLEFIERPTFQAVVQKLKKTIEDFSIVGLVIGLPLNMKGTYGTSAQSVRHFAYNLMKEIPLAALLWDERLSTVAAERALLEADLSRSKRAPLRDKIAAALILQGFLDKLHFFYLLPGKKLS